MRRTLTVIEVVLVAATIGFGVASYFLPEENWEPFLVVSGAFLLVVEILRRRPMKSTIGNRFKSESERIRHRESLRKVFQEEIYKCRAENLREDAIIRHVDRVDTYPNHDEKEEGISAWFKVGLLDTYKKGIQVGLGFGGLREIEGGGYRYVDYVNGEESDITALLMGNIPYDSIVTVNMEGDEYYHFPHIYCHFDFDGGPYERLWFCEMIDQDHGHPYFRELAPHDEVVANNPTDGKLFF